MTPTSPIPVYPPSAPALLVMLLEREKGRLLGPVVMQALVNDNSKGREVEKAVARALEKLEGATQWVALHGGEGE